MVDLQRYRSTSVENNFIERIKAPIFIKLVLIGVGVEGIFLVISSNSSEHHFFEAFMYQNTGNQEKKTISPHFKKLHPLKPALTGKSTSKILVKMQNLPMSKCYILLESIYHVHFQFPIYFPVSCVIIFRSLFNGWQNNSWLKMRSNFRNIEAHNRFCMVSHHFSKIRKFEVDKNKFYSV